MIEIQLLLMLKIFLLGFFVVKFEPIQWVLELISSKIQPDKSVANLLLNTISLMTSCFKCSTFWIGLIMGGLWIALATSFVAHIWSWRVDPIIEKIILPTYVK